MGIEWEGEERVMRFHVTSLSKIIDTRNWQLRLAGCIFHSQASHIEPFAQSQREQLMILQSVIYRE